MSETLILNGKDLTLEDLYSVVYDRRPVQIDPEVIPLVDKSRQVLFDMAADGKPVYGLNHGVGWNKDREFSQDFFEQYNRNLINSHSLGVAPFASVEEVRAMMCIRLNTALCGRTGIASNILKMYEEFLNRGIHPRAMRRGAVGEGDVSTMSMIGQAMIGQGEVEYHGEIIPAIDAMRAEGIEPAILGPKDGLSIVSSNAPGRIHGGPARQGGRRAHQAERRHLLPAPRRSQRRPPAARRACERGAWPARSDPLCRRVPPLPRGQLS